MTGEEELTPILLSEEEEETLGFMNMQEELNGGMDGKDGVGIDRVDSSMSADGAFVNVVIYLTNGTSKVVAIPCGKNGEDGKDYVLTDTDKQLIANLVKGMITIPTKVSELQNDSNFLTEHQSLDMLETKEHASKTYQPKGDYLTEHQDISGKQDVISDLAEIRSGAGKGATALQSLPNDVVRDSNYVHIDNNYTNADKENVGKVSELYAEMTRIDTRVATIELQLTAVESILASI